MNFDIFSEYLRYDNGILYWKKSTSNRVKVGDIAGSEQVGGYIGVRILGKRYPAHTIVYALHYNEMPEIVDHIDGNRKNNRIENLRGCSKAQNNKNTGFRRHNTSGLKNVFWVKELNKWRVKVTVDNKQKYFGVYEDRELAELVAIEARNKHHGKFASHR